MLRLTTLGATDLRDRLGKPVHEILAQPKRFALLVYLVVEGHRGPVARDRVLAMFWPESDAERARNSLSQALHHLRQALGAGVVVSEGTHMLGVDAERLWCDATVFVEALERGDAALALDLYRGEFCPALYVAGAPEVEEWLDTQRRRRRSQAVAAARTLAARLAEVGDRDGARRAARRALALRPEDEADVRALLALLEHAGDGTGALHAYEDYSRRLAAELETQAEPETRQLADAIRRRRDAPAGIPPETDAGARAAALPTGAPHPPAPRPSRRSRALLVAGAVLVVAALGTALTWTRYRRASPPAVRAVAVLPFAVHGGTSLAYLREGMVDLLGAKLAGAAGIRPLDARAVIAVSSGTSESDPSSGEQIARRFGATWFITGDVVEIAGRIQLNGALYATDGGPQAVATASVVGDTTDLFQLVDDLAGRIAAGLLGGRDTALTRLAAVTTRSLPALKAYLAGEQALRAGRDAQAGEAFHEAALLDTTFALAQYRLALSSVWVTIPGVDPLEWARIAARHSQHLTPMVRDLLAAYLAYKEVRWADAEQMYRRLTATYPDHVEAWFMLGETYFHYGWLHGSPPTAAWTPLERVLTLDPGNLHALLHLARLAALEGRTSLLDSLVEGYVGGSGAADRSLEMRALRAYAHDDRAARATIAQEARDADDLVAYSLLEAALVYAQNPDAALDLVPRFRHGVTEGFASVLGHGRRLLVTIGPATGHWDHPPIPWSPLDADERDWLFENRILLAAEPLLPLRRDRVIALRDSLKERRPYPLLKSMVYTQSPGLMGADMQRYLLGLLDTRLGDRGDAERAAQELASGGAGTAGTERVMLAHALRAEIAHAAGNDRGALAELDRFELAPTEWITLPLHWGTRARFLRAEVLIALGRDDEAADLYDSVFSMFDAGYLALAHLRRAQIHVRRGEPDAARFHYGRFLSLWKDCDPELRPLVEQARRELAALPASPQ